MTSHPPKSNPGLSELGRLSDNLTFDFSPPKPGGPLGLEPGLWLATDASGGHAANLLGGSADPFGGSNGAELSYLSGHQNPNRITLPPTPSGTENGVSFSLPPGTTPPVTTPGDSSGLSFTLSSIDFSSKPGGDARPGGGGGGGGGGAPLTLVYGTGGALQFTVTYDSKVTSSKSASQIETAFGNAIGYFTHNFTPLGGSININLNVGWGEVDNMALPSNALGASFTNLMKALNYSDFAQTLNQGTVVSSVPTSGDPLDGTLHNYVMGTAEARAIGISYAPTPQFDGWVGFGSSTNWYFGTGTPRITQYDFIGVAEHEISEAMGRISQLRTTAYLNGDATGATTIDNAYTLFDLFRFDPNTLSRSLVGGEAAKFSFDDMAHMGSSFNTVAGGDYGDWAVPSASQINVNGVNDAYDSGAYAGVQYGALPSDTTVVAALGYGPVSLNSPV